MAEQENEARFIGFLQSLERRQDRGALARLRRSVGKEVPSAESLRLVAPYLPDDKRRSWRVRCYELVAGLFGLHPAAGGSGNMGNTFQRLGYHESAQKRFAALLESDADDLPYRLRQAVSLARSRDVPIDWLRLLRDIQEWNRGDRRVQYWWARAYWGTADSRETQTTAVSAANKKKGE